MWEEVREALGEQDNPTATLKGLRRTFGVRCLRKGMPMRIIQELMRHTSEETTRQYLEVFGLADNPETRKMLNQGRATNIREVGRGVSDEARQAIDDDAGMSLGDILGRALKEAEAASKQPKMSRRIYEDPGMSDVLEALREAGLQVIVLDDEP